MPDSEKIAKDLNEQNGVGALLGFLLFIATTRCVYWVLEQPISSLLFQFQPIVDVIADCDAMRVICIIASTTTIIIDATNITVI